MLLTAKITSQYLMPIIVSYIHIIRAMDVSPNIDLDIDPDIEPGVWQDIINPDPIPIQIPSIDIIPDPIQIMEPASLDSVLKYSKNSSMNQEDSSVTMGSSIEPLDDITQLHPLGLFPAADLPRGGMMISPTNNMCNWKANLGPVCRFNKTIEVVVIPAGLMLNTGKLELEIHDAKVVHVYPACVSWVQIFNASLVTTMIDNKNDVVCRTWLRIYGSVADFVVNGVKDLTLIDSEIYTIRLSNQRDFMAINSVIHNIEMLEWRGYRGTIRNSSVGTMKGMEANDNFYIVDSEIKQILPNGILFNSKEFKISNSSVHEIYENGISVTSGAVTIENVEINMLHKDAITVVGDTAFLALINIKINKADKPCIIMPARGRLSLRNVTINNENITDTSSYVHFNEDRGPDKMYDGPIIYAEKNQNECKVIDTKLVCDFTDNKEVVIISQERLDEFSSVKIIGSDQLFVDPLCTTDLFLEKVNGTLMHSNMSMSAKKSLISAETEMPSEHIDERPCGMGVSIINSSLDIISCKAIKTVDMEKSFVSRLHTGTLSHLKLEDVSIDHLVDTAFNGKESVFKNVKVKSLANFTFYGPLNMNMFFAQRTLEGSLIFDHANQTSEMRNVHFHKLHKGSILVRSGTLKIYDCVISSVEPMSIILEDEAHLVLEGCFFLSVAEHVVSVAREDQAIIPSLTRQFLHIRNNVNTSTSVEPNFSISSSNPKCSKKMFPWSLYCDFAGVNASVDIKLKTRQLVIMNNAYSVDIYPSILIKLILNNVVQATTMESEDDYSFWLEGNNVTFDRIHTGVHDITLRQCRVKLLSPDRELVDIDLEHTAIDNIVGLSWKGYEGVFNNVSIGVISEMQVYGLFTMSDSHVANISKHGIKVNDNGNIINSTLRYIASDGIKITGTMHMLNVVIDNMERESIIVSGGTLLLKNVIIKNATQNSIMAINKGGISFQNVTIGGYDMLLHGYFTNMGSEENPNNQSLILLNKPISDKRTVVPLPSSHSSTMKSTIGLTIPIKAPTPKSSIKPSQDFSKDPRISRAEKNAHSWGWAGAGTGFLCGILVGCSVFMVLKIIRSGNTQSFLPLVLWQVKDDQNELLSSESTRNSVIQDGYTTLPNTDDRSSELFTI